MKVAILVASISASQDIFEDQAGTAIEDQLKQLGVTKIMREKAMPDDTPAIQGCVKNWASEHVQIVIVAGGIGGGPRDGTAQALKPLFSSEVVDLSEALHRIEPADIYGQSVVGMVGNSLVMGIPDLPSAPVDFLVPLYPLMQAATFHVGIQSR